jgi:hypothetical protein
MRTFVGTCALAAGLALLVSPNASAQDVVGVHATLTGGEETPTALLTGAVGTVQMYVDSVNQEIAVEMKVFNLPTGPKGVSGPVVIDFPIGRGITGDTTLNFRVHDGAAFHARPEIGINTFADALQAIVGGNAYVNVHTTANPGGEIRGQVALDPPPVPGYK